jgi:hypothetical protein
VNRDPNLDELIGADPRGAERERLQDVHELLLEAGPPPELSDNLEAGPTLALTLSKPRRAARPRALLLLAAALAIFVVFFAGYGLGNHRSGKTTSTRVLAQALKGTSLAPQAEGTLQVWSSNDGSNFPMTLSVVGLPKLPPQNYYEVYLFRDGKIQTWGTCGSFRVGDSNSAGGLMVTLTSPYPLEKGDSWVVTRPGRGGVEPGQMVLRPVTA